MNYSDNLEPALADKFFEPLLEALDDQKGFRDWLLSNAAEQLRKIARKEEPATLTRWKDSEQSLNHGCWPEESSSPIQRECLLLVILHNSIAYDRPKLIPICEPENSLSAFSDKNAPIDVGAWNYWYMLVQENAGPNLPSFGSVSELAQTLQLVLRVFSDPKSRRRRRSKRQIVPENQYDEYWSFRERLRDNKVSDWKSQLAIKFKFNINDFKTIDGRIGRRKRRSDKV